MSGWQHEAGAGMESSRVSSSMLARLTLQELVTLISPAELYRFQCMSHATARAAETSSSALDEHYFASHVHNALKRLQDHEEGFRQAEEFVVPEYNDPACSFLLDELDRRIRAATTIQRAFRAHLGTRRDRARAPAQPQAHGSHHVPSRGPKGDVAPRYLDGIVTSSNGSHRQTQSGPGEQHARPEHSGSLRTAPEHPPGAVPHQSSPVSTSAADALPLSDLEPMEKARRAMRAMLMFTPPPKWNKAAKGSRAKSINGGGAAGAMNPFASLFAPGSLSGSGSSWGFPGGGGGRSGSAPASDAGSSAGGSRPWTPQGGGSLREMMLHSMMFRGDLALMGELTAAAADGQGGMAAAIRRQVAALMSQLPASDEDGAVAEMPQLLRIREFAEEAASLAQVADESRSRIIAALEEEVARIIAETTVAIKTIPSIRRRRDPSAWQEEERARFEAQHGGQGASAAAAAHAAAGSSGPTAGDLLNLLDPKPHHQHHHHHLVAAAPATAGAGAATAGSRQRNHYSALMAGRGAAAHGASTGASKALRAASTGPSLSKAPGQQQQQQRQQQPQSRSSVSAPASDALLYHNRSGWGPWAVSDAPQASPMASGLSRASAPSAPHPSPLARSSLATAAERSSTPSRRQQRRQHQPHQSLLARSADWAAARQQQHHPQNPAAYALVPQAPSDLRGYYAGGVYQLEGSDACSPPPPPGMHYLQQRLQRQQGTAAELPGLMGSQVPLSRGGSRQANHPFHHYQQQQHPQYNNRDDEYYQQQQRQQQQRQQQQQQQHGAGDYGALLQQQSSSSSTVASLHRHRQQPLLVLQEGPAGGAGDAQLLLLVAGGPRASRSRSLPAPLGPQEESLAAGATATARGAMLAAAAATATIPLPAFGRKSRPDPRDAPSPSYDGDDRYGDPDPGSDDADIALMAVLSASAPGRGAGPTSGPASCTRLEAALLPPAACMSAPASPQSRVMITEHGLGGSGGTCAAAAAATGASWGDGDPNGSGSPTGRDSRGPSPQDARGSFGQGGYGGYNGYGVSLPPSPMGRPGYRSSTGQIREGSPSAVGSPAAGSRASGGAGPNSGGSSAGAGSGKPWRSAPRQSPHMMLMGGSGGGGGVGSGAAGNAPNQASSSLDGPPVACGYATVATSRQLSPSSPPAPLSAAETAAASAAAWPSKESGAGEGSRQLQLPPALCAQPAGESRAAVASAPTNGGLSVMRSRSSVGSVDNRKQSKVGGSTWANREAGGSQMGQPLLAAVDASSSGGAATTATKRAGPRPSTVMGIGASETGGLSWYKPGQIRLSIAAGGLGWGNRLPTLK